MPKKSSAHRDTRRNIRCRIVLAASLLLLASLDVAAQETGTGEAVTVDMARAVLDAGRAVEAERMFREVLARQPYRVDAHRGLAAALAARGERAAATAQLRALGDGLLRAGRSELAAEVLAEASALAPGDAALVALLGRARLLAQDFGGAVEALEAATAAGERGAATRLYLAAALWEAGRPEDAEPIYRQLAEETGAFTALHQFGRLLVWQGREAEAVPYLERAAAARREAVDVLLDLAAAREGSGALAEALDAYRRAATARPENVRARYGLARMLARTGDVDGARREMETYRRLQAAEQERTRRQGLERARLDRGWELLDAGQAAAAREHFAALEQSPESLAGRAQADAALGDHAAAVEALERALDLDPERDDLRRLLFAQRLAMDEGAVPP